jgi:hypothetical protein
MKEKIKVKQCVHCPLRDDTTLVCTSVATGNDIFCRWVDPKGPKFRADVVMTVLRLARRTRAVHVSGPEDQGPFLTRDEAALWPPDVRKPDPPGPPDPRTLVMHPDPEAHMAIYEAARSCPDRTAHESCCGPVDRCGPSGRHGGSVVTIATCYPCAADRLGIAIEPRFNENFS